MLLSFPINTLFPHAGHKAEHTTRLGPLLQAERSVPMSHPCTGGPNHCSAPPDTPGKCLAKPGWHLLAARRFQRMSTFSFSQCSSSLFLSASFWKKYMGMDRASRKISLLPEEKLQANYRLVHSFYVCAARGMSALPHSLPPRHIPHHPSSLLSDGAADVPPSVIKAPCSFTGGSTW